MGKQTALYERHRQAGARMVDFGGWDMPVHYGSQLDEHHAVREDAGVFDVSHMTVIDIEGAGSSIFLSCLLANDVHKLQKTGKALYTCMLNENGGILDDLIVYRRISGYRLVTNCATRDKDLKWIADQASEFDVSIDERQDLAILALQGPHVLAKMEPSFTRDQINALAALGSFESVEWDGMQVATTGYTGEEGFELILDNDQAVSLWDSLVKAGIRPVGLGARDTLRLEAGMNLYGSDMDESVTPYESALGWTVSLSDEREFVGRSALEAQKQKGIGRQLVALVLQDKGVIRGGYRIFREDDYVGDVTSGIFSPTLGCSIAFARLVKGKGELAVEIRKKRQPVTQVTPPFVRNGKQVFKPIG